MCDQRAEPGAKQWVWPFLSAKEFLDKARRWCLWLEGITPTDLKALPRVRERVERVRDYREESKRETTQELADPPTR